MRIVFISPPPLKPSEPGTSAPAAAQALTHLGAQASSIDAAIGWHAFALTPARLKTTLAALVTSATHADEVPSFRRAVVALDKAPPILRRPATYASRSAYSSAIAHLENALALVAAPYPDLRLGIANIVGKAGDARAESSAWLAAFASSPGPYDAYFMEELIPRLRRDDPTHIGISLTFREQAPAGCRLARLLAEELPTVVRLVGGPLVACLTAVGHALDRAPFDLFDRVLAGSDAELEILAAEVLGATPGPRLPPAEPLSVDLDHTVWDAYLTPEPIVPVALGRGCYWRRCTFCPEGLQPAHRVCDRAALGPWLRRVADRFPTGAMLHLVDSALPMTHLDELATVISREQLPLRWHGFVRVEPELASPDFARQLAAGGCVMLQLGVESGSPRLLQRMGKGTTPELSRRVLRATAAAGIRNQVYLLFGMPTETDADRETLALVEEEAEAIHAMNPALFNLPRGAPMHQSPASFGITELRPFSPDTDLSLYDDFRCGQSHPRLEARRWLDRRFFKSARVRAISGHLRAPLKANHLCFL